VRTRRAEHVHYVEAIGADRILLSWDYPHFDRTFPHSVDVLAKAGLSDEDPEGHRHESVTALRSLSTAAVPLVPAPELPLGARGSGNLYA